MKLLEKRYDLKLEGVVDLLLSYKAKGESVCYDFNGHMLYSDTVTMDSAYLEVTGFTKKQFDERLQDFFKQLDIEEEAAKRREEAYKERVAESNNNQPQTITMDQVIIGLKFIAEHRDMPQEELVDKLLELGCNFTLEDIKEELKKHQEEDISLFEGMKKGFKLAGASVVVNARDSEFGRDYADDRFLSVDDETSIYAFVRKVTNDPNYTKENLEHKKTI